MWRLNANASSGSVSLHVSGDIISPPPLTLRILQFIPQPKEAGEFLFFYRVCPPFLYSMTEISLIRFFCRNIFLSDLFRKSDRFYKKIFCKKKMEISFQCHLVKTLDFFLHLFHICYKAFLYENFFFCYSD